MNSMTPAVRNFYVGMAAGRINTTMLTVGDPFLQPAVQALQWIAPNPETMPPHQVRLAADLVRHSGERTVRLFQSPEEVLAEARRAVGYRPTPPKPDFPNLHLPFFSHRGFRKAVKGLYDIVERDGRPLPSIWIDLWDDMITKPLYNPEPSKGHFQDPKTGKDISWIFHPPELPDRSSEKFNAIMTVFARAEIPHLPAEGAGELFRFLLVLLGCDYVGMGSAEMIAKKSIELIKSTAEEGRLEMMRMAINQSQEADSFTRLVNTSWLIASLLYLNMCEEKTYEDLTREGMIEILRAMHCASQALATSIFFPVIPLHDCLTLEELKSVVELLFPGIYSKKSLFKETDWVRRKIAEGTFPPLWMESYHASMTIDILLMGLTPNEALLLFEEAILPLLKSSDLWFQKGGKPTLQNFRDWLKTKYDLNPKNTPFVLAGLATYNPELFPENQ